jgi:hypothetical protein
MPRESSLVKDIKDYVGNVGGLAIKLNVNGYGMAGLPDILCFIPSYGAVMVEVKVRGKRPTRIQEAVIDRINASGGRAFWCDSLESFFEGLRAYSEESI